MTKKFEHYLKKWNLSNPHFIAQTFTSEVYRVKSRKTSAVLKILNSVGIKDEKFGAQALSCFSGEGAVRLFEFDGEALLMEFLEGPSLASLVEQGNDDSATEIIADILNQLHSSSGNKGNLTSLEDRFRSLFKKSKQCRNARNGSLYIHAAEVAQSLLSTQSSPKILHGDLHHENVLHSARGWLSIDPKGLWGDRTFDACNVLYNPSGFNDLVESEDRVLKVASILSEKMDIDYQRLLNFSFAFGCLSACWSIEDNQSPERAIKIANILRRHTDI